MNKSIQAAYEEAMATQPQRQSIITIELWHPSFTQPAYICSDNQDFKARKERGAQRDAGAEVVYKAVWFEFVRGAVKEEAVTDAKLKTANVSRELADKILGASFVEGAIEVLVREYLADDPSQPVNNPPLRFELGDVQMTMTTIEGALKAHDLTTVRVPKHVYTPENHPGLMQ